MKLSPSRVSPWANWRPPGPLRPLAEAATTWGYIRPTVSKSTVRRWLKAAALEPHRVQRWLHSPDPDLRYKVRRVVRWYLRRRRGLRVLCVDEKKQVQVLERLHPGRRMRPGHAERLEDRRHGTLAVLAGWDVRTGRVVTQVRRRRRGQEFLQLLGRRSPRQER